MNDDAMDRILGGSAGSQAKGRSEALGSFGEEADDVDLGSLPDEEIPAPNPNDPGFDARHLTPEQDARVRAYFDQLKRTMRRTGSVRHVLYQQGQFDEGADHGVWQYDERLPKRRRKEPAKPDGAAQERRSVGDSVHGAVASACELAEHWKAKVTRCGARKTRRQYRSRVSKKGEEEDETLLHRCHNCANGRYIVACESRDKNGRVEKTHCTFVCKWHSQLEGARSFDDVRADMFMSHFAFTPAEEKAAAGVWPPPARRGESATDRARRAILHRYINHYQSVERVRDALSAGAKKRLSEKVFDATFNSQNANAVGAARGRKALTPWRRAVRELQALRAIRAMLVLWHLRGQRGGNAEALAAIDSELRNRHTRLRRGYRTTPAVYANTLDEFRDILGDGEGSLFEWLDEQDGTDGEEDEGGVGGGNDRGDEDELLDEGVAANPLSPVTPMSPLALGDDDDGFFDFLD